MYNEHKYHQEQIKRSKRAVRNSKIFGILIFAAEALPVLLFIAALIIYPTIKQ